MLSKESKIRVLENFYALDYVFFGKPVSKVDSCCPLIKEEYISIKGALLSVFVEMIKMIDHKPTSLTEKVNSVVLGQMARESAKIARSNAQKIVSTPKARQNIKEMLKEELKKNPKINISETVEKAITLKAFGLAVDNMLIARTITESENVNSLNEWEGTIVEDSYKILRDNLIESALMILEKDEEEIEEGAGTVIGGAILGGLAGLLTPVPFGAISGAIMGGAAGLGLAHQRKWRLQNKARIEKYCKEKAAKAGISMSDCMKVGSQAMKADLEKAKQRAKQKLARSKQ